MVSQVTIIWSATAGAALLLGIVHALVWGYDRRRRGNLAFAVATLGLAASALIELEMLHAKTPQQWAPGCGAPVAIVGCRRTARDDSHSQSLQ
jgi:peptidoglycan/LPS O-acetylase OafA/YrhL